MSTISEQLDKININVGGERGGDGGSAAMIAALLNGRNQDGGIAALAPLLAGMNNNNGGINSLWPLLLLLGRGRGGMLGGDGGDCGAVGSVAGLSPAQAAMLQTLLEGQSSLRAEVPTTALQTQAEIQGALSSLALGTQQGFAGVKDAVQSSAGLLGTAIAASKDTTQNAFALLSRDLAAVNQNVSAQGCETRETVMAAENRIISRLDQNTIDELRSRADRAERAIEINSLRSQVEVNQTVTTTQAQGQQQGQVQFQIQDVGNQLRRVCDLLVGVQQEQRSTNSVINAGNVGASTIGAQTSTPTQVNAR